MLSPISLQSNRMATIAVAGMLAFALPTDTMPTALRQFAEYEPFTPITQTTRGLLTGGPVGAHAIAAVSWSVGIALVSYVWSVRLYNRCRAATPI
jgi:ABC-type polysaccharide/polyol phosphate export permease